MLSMPRLQQACNLHMHCLGKDAQVDNVPKLHIYTIGILLIYMRTLVRFHFITHEFDGLNAIYSIFNALHFMEVKLGVKQAIQVMNIGILISHTSLGLP